MKKVETLSPIEWISYWHALAQRECKKSLAFIKRHASSEARLDELLATLTSEQQAVIRTAIDMAKKTAQLHAFSELREAFEQALEHADNGVQPGDKPRIVK